MRKGEMVIRREFQAFGTRAEIIERLGKNGVLPRMGEVLPLSVPLDPDQQPDFINQLKDLGSKDAGLGREWRDRLHVGDIQVEGNPSERTTHKVIVDYSTSAPADPFAPVVQINVGSETLLVKWDDEGNPIALGFEGGIPVEVPIVHLSYTIPMQLFGELFDEVAEHVGKTNETSWKLYDNASADEHQWVFLGADAQKGGELNWKTTFRFVWYPPIAIQHFFKEEKPNGDIVTEAVILRERGLYFYWFIEKADGSINQKPTRAPIIPGATPRAPTTAVPGENMHGLQRVVIRQEFDFNPFFRSDGIDAELKG